MSKKLTRKQARDMIDSFIANKPLELVARVIARLENSFDVEQRKDAFYREMAPIEEKYERARRKASAAFDAIETPARVEMQKARSKYLKEFNLN